MNKKILFYFFHSDKTEAILAAKRTVAQLENDKLAQSLVDAIVGADGSDAPTKETKKTSFGGMSEAAKLKVGRTRRN